MEERIRARLFFHPRSPFFQEQSLKYTNSFFHIQDISEDVSGRTKYTRPPSYQRQSTSSLYKIQRLLDKC
jgi:hypothetical protein